jgi:Cytochrome C and Quinol oxidase polypeptide I
MTIIPLTFTISLCLVFAFLMFLLVENARAQVSDAARDSLLPRREETPRRIPPAVGKHQHHLETTGSLRLPRWLPAALHRLPQAAGPAPRPWPRPAMSGQKITLEFNDKVVRQFLIASLLWVAVGMLIGVLIALQLNFRPSNFSFPWLTWDRLRPLHTNAVVFALVGNLMFAGVYYSTQRLVKARLASDFLSALHFWGLQLFIVAAALTLPLGLTRGKEYAELIWPVKIAVTLIWVVFAVNLFWTLARRREPSLYVAICSTCSGKRPASITSAAASAASGYCSK